MILLNDIKTMLEGGLLYFIFYRRLTIFQIMKGRNE